jgi:hypothetical protein
MSTKKDTTLKKPSWVKVDVDWLSSLFDRLSPREVGFYMSLVNYALKNEGKVPGETNAIRRITREDERFIGAFLSEFDDDLIEQQSGHFVVPHVVTLMKEYASLCEVKRDAGRAGGMAKKAAVTKAVGGTGTVVYLNGDPDAK